MNTAYVHHVMQLERLIACLRNEDILHELQPFRNAALPDPGRTVEGPYYIQQQHYWVVVDKSGQAPCESKLAAAKAVRWLRDPKAPHLNVRGAIDMAITLDQSF